MGKLQEQSKPEDVDEDLEGVIGYEEPYIISAQCMEVIMDNLHSIDAHVKRRDFTAMVDMGANVGVAPRFAISL